MDRTNFIDFIKDSDSKEAESQATYGRKRRRGLQGLIA
jgi:hypothetical protein